MKTALVLVLLLAPPAHAARCSARQPDCDSSGPDADEDRLAPTPVTKTQGTGTNTSAAATDVTGSPATMSNPVTGSGPWTPGGPPGGDRDPRGAQPPPSESDRLRNRAYAAYESGDMAGACATAKQVLAANPGDDAARSIMHLSCGAGVPKAEPLRVAPAPPPPPTDVMDIDRKLAPIPAAEHSPAESRRLAQFARSSLRGGRFSDARTRASQALLANPDNVDARYLRARANAGLGDWPGAIGDADEGLRRLPSYVPLLDQKAFAQNKARDFKGALETSRRALALDPNDAAALANLAYALGALGDRERMLDALRRAAELDPRFQHSLDTALQPPEDAVFYFPGEGRPASGAQAEAPSGGRDGLALALGAGALIFVIPLLGVAAWAALSSRGLAPAAAPDSTPAAVPAVALRSSVEGADGLRDQAADGRELPVVGIGRREPLKGRYRLGRQIGVGGMGRVFEAQDQSLGRRVAVKQMREELKAAPDELARFVNEAKTLAQLTHPFIVGVHDVVDHAGELYIVFDYVDGKTLADEIRDKGRLPPGDCRRILKQVCEAMDFAHGKKVLHRDLKPANIMLASDGYARVMDFGLARQAKDTLARISSAHASGTPAYMAPEQHYGRASPASDVYALGVCLYEMLTGKLPFAGPDPLAQKQAAAFEAPRAVVPALGAQADTCVAALLAPDPDKRPAGAKAALALIEQVY